MPTYSISTAFSVRVYGTVTVVADSADAARTSVTYDNVQARFEPHSRDTTDNGVFDFTGASDIVLSEAVNVDTSEITDFCGDFRRVSTIADSVQMTKIDILRRTCEELAAVALAAMSIADQIPNVNILDTTQRKAIPSKELLKRVQHAMTQISPGPSLIAPNILEVVAEDAIRILATPVLVSDESAPEAQSNETPGESA